MSLLVDIEKNFGSFNLKVKFSTNGGISSFLGASGSGKSLTLKCIAGIITPDKGRIVLNGRVLFDSSEKINLKIQDRNVGYFFQDYALFPNMLVKQNIYMGMKRFGKDYDKQSEYDKVTKMLHIDNLSDRKIEQISGGQKQRVALARILVNHPEIILFDEPFSALDEHLRTRLQMELKNTLQELNQEAILVTHSRDEAYMLSLNTMIIDNGTIVESGDTKQLFKNPNHYETAIITGCKNITPIKHENGKTILSDWGIRLNRKSEGFTHIGVRAHSFKEGNKDNGYKINIVDVNEEPFEKLVRFRFENQVSESDDVYYRIPKNQNAPTSGYISFDEDSILYLVK